MDTIIRIWNFNIAGMSIGTAIFSLIISILGTVIYNSLPKKRIGIFVGNKYVDRKTRRYLPEEYKIICRKEYAYLSEIRIINCGKEVVDRSDISENDPLRVVFDNGIMINGDRIPLICESLQKKDKRFSIDYVNEGDGNAGRKEIIIKFEYLEPKEGLGFVLLHTGSLRFEGKVKGTKIINLKSKYTRNELVGLIISSCIIFLCTPIVDKSLQSLIAGIILIIVSYLLFFFIIGRSILKTDEKYKEMYDEVRQNLENMEIRQDNVNHKI